MANASKPNITLHDYQVKHYDKIANILRRNYFYVDVSEMGLGKTYVLLALATAFNLRIVVVAPPAARGTWSEATKNYNTPDLVTFMSYEAMRGSKEHGINTENNMYIVREDTTNGVFFRYTTQWRDLCATGIILVFDECHMLKNSDTDTCKAAAQLMLGVRLSGQSRAALLSATLLDKDDHLLSYLYVMGYINEPKLSYYDHSQGQHILTGFLNVYNACLIYNAPATNAIVPDIDAIGKNSMLDKCCELYFTVMHRLFTSRMTSDKIPRLCFRGFFDIDPNYIGEVMSAVDELNHATVMKSRDGKTGINYGQVSSILHRIEDGIVQDFVNIAAGWLRDDPLCKVILSYNNLSAVEASYNALKNYGVDGIMITGKDSKNRDANVEKFNNNDNCRFCIMTGTSGGLSLNLQDKQGGRRRYMLISPNYNMTNIHQITGRIFRQGQKSLGAAFVFYPKVGNLLAKILATLAMKSETVKKTLKDLMDDEIAREDRDLGIIFPGEYPRFIDGYGAVNESLVSDEYKNDTGALINALMRNDPRTTNLIVRS